MSEIIDSFLFPTAAEVEGSIKTAIREVARALGVRAVDYTPAVDLLDEIKAVDQQGYKHVVEFGEAFGGWFRTTQRLRSVGGAKGSAPDEKTLMDAIERRDRARESLIKWLAGKR